MAVIIILFFTTLLYLSYLAFCKRFTMILVVIVVWMISSFLMELDLMNIDSVNPTTYLIIFIGFFSMFCGFIASRSVRVNYNSNANAILTSEVFYRLIFLLSTSVVLINATLMILKYGGVAFIISNANALYGDRIAGEYRLAIPFLGSLDLIVCALGGFHLVNTKKTIGSILYFCLLPLFIIILDSAINLGRATILIGFFVYGSSFFYSSYKKGNFKLRINVRQVLIFSIVLMGIWFLLIVIRDVRGGYENYRFKKELPVIQELDELGLFRPSIYLYFVSPIAVLDNSIDYDFDDRVWIPFKETFAPIVRILAKPFGIEVERYEADVDIGIRKVNTGTMLKDFYMDLHLPGVIVLCFMLGFIFHRLTKLWIVKDSYIVELSLISAYLLMSIFVNLFRSGQFLFPLVFFLVIRNIFKYKWKLL
ncbi:oligosaccharide repeat unit polymerase [Labilibaculum sp. A4]|uniref:O-antigen polymerase n=1 Tax=Labilibaculum euxinus TaxID=2686357 RepID=UPI000F622027|nr:O-antigen polymerase [Labilibaculum euxinus]MDQ1772719.1 O-antigen polymerase [Labilibaculum euxinus]MWN78323.1 oligosaccharide repeat unit polymerase [Labilibaculum euxinus]